MNSSESLRPSVSGLNRRQLFRLMLGAAVTAFLGGGAARGETLAAPLSAAPEEEVGPYYIDLERFRKDITEGKPGLPLRLQVNLVNTVSQRPLEGAVLDIWHCDARGFYSGYTANNPDGGPGGGPGGFNGPPPPPLGGGEGGPLAGQHPPVPKPTDSLTFLRGVQVTDREGAAEFVTIYPGWYAGRDIHIHLRVHVGGTVAEGRYQGGSVCHTGQLFFPPSVSDEVLKLEPYAGRSGRRTTQREDHVFVQQQGEECLLRLQPMPGNGYVGSITLGVDPAARPVEV